MQINKLVLIIGVVAVFGIVSNYTGMTSITGLASGGNDPEKFWQDSVQKASKLSDYTLKLNVQGTSEHDLLKLNGSAIVQFNANQKELNFFIERGNGDFSEFNDLHVFDSDELTCTLRDYLYGSTDAWACYKAQKDALKKPDVELGGAQIISLEFGSDKIVIGKGCTEVKLDVDFSNLDNATKSQLAPSGYSFENAVGLKSYAVTYCFDLETGAELETQVYIETVEGATMQISENAIEEINA